MNTEPAGPAIVCTLPADQTPDRVDAWRALLATAVDRRPIDDGVALRFAPDVTRTAELAGLAAAEQSCCAFFDFTIRITADATELEVRAPAEAFELVSGLFGSG